MPSSSSYRVAKPSDAAVVAIIGCARCLRNNLKCLVSPGFRTCVNCRRDKYPCTSRVNTSSAARIHTSIREIRSNLANIARIVREVECFNSSSELSVDVTDASLNADDCMFFS
jgi:hypothetical protein